MSQAPLWLLALGGILLVILLWQVSPVLGGGIAVVAALALASKATQEGLL